MVETRVAMLQGKPSGILVYPNNVVYSDRLANKYLASGQAVIGVTATAIIVQNIIIQFTVDGYFAILDLLGAAFPTKTFTDRYLAHIWLEKYKNKYSGE